ncbi:MAG: MMPL family transporter [Leptospiraceae bacterium]|nr:MMPL family transporter [Leptospiraceae bacterium]
MRTLVSFLCKIFLVRPILSLLGLILILFLSYNAAGKLTINSNQIDLLPADYPEVVKTKRVVEMIGGNGFYTIVLKLIDEKGMSEHLAKAFAAKKKGNLEKYKEELGLSKQAKEMYKDYYKEKELLLKESSDILATHLLKEEDVRYINYRFDDVTYLQDRFPLFIQNEDLEEVRNRVKKKLDYEKEKLNPFIMDIGEEYKPDFTDIIEKYSKLSKRDIFDAYNISEDKGMLIMLVKPTGSFVDMAFTKQFEDKVKKIVAEHDFASKGIHVGYTGTYKLNLDDYDSLINALKPVSIASLIGIILLLLFFFRNPIFIIILTVSLVSGVLITFGLTQFFIGRLNTITSIMAAVLMGLGIDYGIQFLYRFREEFTLRGEFIPAVKETIYHTGMASFISACTTTSAFVVLMFSEFKGFSEFGLIACYGIISIAFCMYFVTAIQIGIVLQIFPSSAKLFLVSTKPNSELGFVGKFFQNPRKVLLISGITILLLGLFAPLVKFNYSGRDLLLENQESLLLYDEIGDRFDVSSDPQVIVVDTQEEAEAIYDYFNPMNEKMAKTLDQVVSAWSMVPRRDQVVRNLATLERIKEDIKPVKPSMLDQEQRKQFPKMKALLDVEEFSMEDIPKPFRKPFQEVPTSKDKGFMLFVYPKIALWHGKDLLSFYDTVGEFSYPYISKRTVNALLYSEEIDLSKSTAGDHRNWKYTPEEEKIILEKANTLSEKEFDDLDILPRTAKFIIENRPYKTISELNSKKPSPKANTVGSVILFAKLAQIVQSEAKFSILGTLAIVTMILLIFYRSLVAALVSLIPLLLGILAMLGIMGIIGVKVNFFNILVFPIIIGYAIQNGIYIYYRYLEERDITRTLEKVGPAVVASTLTTLVGWSVLLIAQHRGLHSLGFAASIGIATTLLVALTLLPALLERYFSSGRKTSTAEIGLNINSTAKQEEFNKMTQFVEDFLEFQNENEIIKPEKKRAKAPSKKKPTSKKKKIAKKKSS